MENTRKMKTFICETKLFVDIDKMVEEYKKALADGKVSSIEEYILDFWSGLDDCYYSCDNDFAIRLEIRNLMRQAIADGNK